MPEWLFALVPLLVLPVVLLMAFAGCFLDDTGTGVAQGPYHDSVQGEPGLVSYWRLEEPGGPVANDSQGGQHGTYGASGVTFGQDGAIQPKDPTDKSAKFDGAAGHVEVGFDGALNPDSFSLEAWANPEGPVTGEQRVVLSSRHEEGDVRRGFELLINPAGDWVARVGSGVAGEDWQTVSTDVGTSDALGGGWRHLVVTYDGTANTLRLYVNSALTESPGAVTHSKNASKPLRIGAGLTEAAAGNFFTGRIDEVAVYNLALSKEHVSTHFAAAFLTP